jgi:hypothetical protein
LDDASGFAYTGGFGETGEFVERRMLFAFSFEINTDENCRLAGNAFGSGEKINSHRISDTLKQRNGTTTG